MSSNVEKSIEDRNYEALKQFHTSYDKSNEKEHGVIGIEKNSQGHKYLVIRLKKDLSLFRRLLMKLGMGDWSLNHVVKYINSSQFKACPDAKPYLQFLQKRIEHHNEGQNGKNPCSKWRKVENLSLSFFSIVSPKEKEIVPQAKTSVKNAMEIDLSTIDSCSYSEDENTNTLKIGDGEIVLSRNDNIATHPADFIVNAANSGMLGGSGVDGAITNAGGDVLALFRKLVPETSKGRCPEGEARLTDAGDLPGSICVHAVGPRFDKSEHEKHRETLKQTYLNVFTTVHNYLAYLAEGGKDPWDTRRPLSLENILKEKVEKKEESSQKEDLKAKLYDASVLKGEDKLLEKAQKSQNQHETKLREKIAKGEALTISLPTIGTGIFDYPKDEGAWIALASAIEYLKINQGKKNALKSIHIVFINEQKDVPFYLNHIKNIVKSKSV